MITLAAGCLLFELSSGESIPFSAEMISVELMGESARVLDPELVQHAAQAVFHYFRHELCRKTVTVAEFSGALEKVLRGFKLQTPASPACPPELHVLESDLDRLARESGAGCELFFFPLLRDELRAHLRQSPRVVRFRGLRGCVKQLVGARRWTMRCRNLEEQIVGYLRECLTAETRQTQFALVVE
ncbi:MAG TPA: hypothetical protein VN578_24215 [Candidatus Binatia bacterium]|jgi:hypothetical protein|nr:hypothetical protein [Candidatus Binatia bacterium]